MAMTAAVADTQNYLRRAQRWSSRLFWIETEPRSYLVWEGWPQAIKYAVGSEPEIALADAPSTVQRDMQKHLPLFKTWVVHNGVEGLRDDLEPK